ncbi:hypothetical protein J437_LFUL002014 [Ladona fulva]|uniref:NADH dehydrogenase [ubiquinone] 1 alpha subcomplex assembly factor 4 n=1 Tax=Ladona fulva TaxID=123851 RepID=A0A8K0JUU0_LADFU|nr:hypothetical protein J437_LFUL002014 [Ladona fulva]
MGLIVSSLTRRIKSFNIENRAHREISKEKPSPAPRYPSTAKEIERIMKENPEIVNQHLQKNEELYERLKEVYLTSQDIKIEPKKVAEGTRPLPLNRSAPEDTDFGFPEPSMLPKGRITLRQALKLISDYQSDPSSKPISAIAAEHNLGVEMTENIVKYFKTFELYVPETKTAATGTKITEIESGEKVKDDK